MKKIIVLLVLALQCSVLTAAYENTGYAARARGMADAFYGWSGGVSSIGYNPAGTAFIKSFELTGALTLPYTGFSTFGITSFEGAAVYPLGFNFNPKIAPVFKNMVVGLGFHNVSYSYQNSIYYNNDDMSYSERLMTLNISKDLSAIFRGIPQISVGLNFNLFLRDLGANADSLAGNAYFSSGLGAAGFGMDMGVLWLIGLDFSAGLAVDNLVEPNVAFNKDLSSEQVNRRFKAGVAWNKDVLWKLHSTTLSAGVTFEDLKQQDWDYHLGFEFWEFNGLMGVRFGYQFSDAGMNDVCLGLSVKKTFRREHELEIDYAAVLPLTGIQGTYGTHEINLVYRLKFAGITKP